MTAKAKNEKLNNIVGRYHKKEDVPKTSGVDIRKQKNAFLESVKNINIKKDKQMKKINIFNNLVKLFCL